MAVSGQFPSRAQLAPTSFHREHGETPKQKHSLLQERLVSTETQ